MAPKTKWTTELVTELMNQEGCEFQGVYINSKTKITYKYEDQTYTVLWSDWLFKNSRPHLHGGNREQKERTQWNNENVNELFKKESCELNDEYKNSKQRLCYLYEGSKYWVTLDDWIYKHSRPHLNEWSSETRFRKYLEEHKIEFETQKSFKGLRDYASKYKLRFDFYIPSMKLLVEIDDVSHKYDLGQRARGIIKDMFCEQNKIKLLRIDAKSDVFGYEKALAKINEETNKYVLMYGKMYGEL